MFKKILFTFLILIGYSVNAQDVIKVMFYNLLEFPSASPANRAIILKNIIDEYEPDIFMVCELENESGANLILNTSLNDTNTSYSKAPFSYNQSGNNSLQQLLFYRTSSFTLGDFEVITTNIRDINKYVLLLNTADQQTDPVFLNVYVTHLKAGQDENNEDLRLGMVNDFTNSLNAINPEAHVIFAGDLNLYTSAEPAYQELLDTSNAITLKDPLNMPGSWHNNFSFRSIHTQSTRTSSAPFDAGAGGGIDDRFDFILVSENMLSDPKLKYKPNTYKSFGNNGNCFNESINDGSCTGEFGNALRENLYNMSDHLPVIMELETEKDILSIETSELTNPLVYLESTHVKDKLQIHISEGFQVLPYFEIYSSLGQKIMTINPKNLETVSIDISYLSSGIYYIKTNLPIKPLKFLKTS